MGMNESSGDELMFIFVIKGILHIPANSPVRVATVFCETERTRSQARAIVSFLIISPRAIVSLPEWPEV